ncbi:MAG: sodium-translocating pyrophosphatase [Myxococcales bacterium]|nr:sodium-translocating pyrophosphatase [Myxococcales bacterium]
MQNVLVISSGLVGLSAAALTTRWLLRKPRGEGLVVEIGLLIQQGAMAFLRREYSVLSLFALGVAALLGALIDYDVLQSPGLAEAARRSPDAPLPPGPWRALAYLAGAAASGLAGFIGMNVAVQGNTRTANACDRTLNEGLRVAFATGSVMGFVVVGFGLLGVTVFWMVFQHTGVLASFAFGASTIALFGRVGGGIFTKAADVGADLVGKVESDLPEDDARNPAVIADNVGDNVGDVAGMGADLFESYVGSLVAALTLVVPGAVALGLTRAAEASISAQLWQQRLAWFPMTVAAIGILGSVAAIGAVRTRPEAGMKQLMWALRRSIFLAAFLCLGGTALLVFGSPLPWQLFAVVGVGLVSGEAVGLATEYFTSYEYRPVQWIAKQAPGGAASVIIAGVAVGFASTALPALILGTAIWLTSFLAGAYGVALAGVGMLATLGSTLATDAYGPVADNAGGLAEQAHLPPHVRQRTDALDALGNTTAATGKGFAVGSAVLTALALMTAYGFTTGVTNLNLLDPPVLVGALTGATMPFVFSALTMHAVGKAAGAIIEEVRRQFREIPGLREGRAGVKPDSTRAVDISTRSALRAMVAPGVLAVAAPIAVGALLGPYALGGLLLGALLSGFLLAVFMANAGGAWDNAKKYIEAGHHGGKHSDAHRAAVHGDTVGDPFKDTSGPSLNILLKLMAIVSVIFGPLFL